MNKKRMRPILAGEWKLIGQAPVELNDLPKIDQKPDPRPIEMVDHHIFQADDGKWHLWGCVRNTPVGRVLYHWDADALTDSPWRCTKEVIRIDRSYGECENEGTSEQIQSPFIVKHDNKFYMFYGGVHAKIDENTEIEDSKSHLYASLHDCQMCLMTSDDGKTWERHKNEKGQSRVFCGPGATRDPSLIKIDDLWYMYYTGFHTDPNSAGVYLRTSQNLLDWSEPKVVHYDEHFGHHHAMNECPTVIKHDDLYYLFVTESYYKKRTHIWCSTDPTDFGVDDYADADTYDGNDYYVGRIKVAAPEIITDTNGDEYITSNHDPAGGTLLTRLGWEDWE